MSSVREDPFLIAPRSPMDPRHEAEDDIHFSHVMAAQAAIHDQGTLVIPKLGWIPAFAGMAVEFEGDLPRRR